MSDVQAVNYAATYGSKPIGKTPSNVNGGRMRVLYDTLTTTGEVAGTDVLIGRFGDGVVIHDWVVNSADLGTAVTLQLATRDTDTAATENTFSQALDVATAASINRPVAADLAELPLFVDEDTEVIAKIAGGAATGLFKVQIFYSIT